MSYVFDYFQDLKSLAEIYWKFGFQVADQFQLTQRGSLQSFYANKHIKQLRQFIQQAKIREEQFRFRQIIQFWQQRIVNARTRRIEERHMPKQDDNLITPYRSRKRKLIKKGLTYNKSIKSDNEKQAATRIFNQILNLDKKVQKEWQNYHGYYHVYKNGKKSYHLKNDGKKRKGESCGKTPMFESVLKLQNLYKKEKCVNIIKRVSKNVQQVNQNVRKIINRFLKDITKYLESEYTVTRFFYRIYYNQDSLAKVLQTLQTQRSINDTLEKFAILPISTKEQVNKQLTQAWKEIQNIREKNQTRCSRRNKKEKKDPKRNLRKKKEKKVNHYKRK